MGNKNCGGVCVVLEIGLDNTDNLSFFYKGKKVNFQRTKKILDERGYDLFKVLPKTIDDNIQSEAKNNCILLSERAKDLVKNSINTLARHGFLPALVLEGDKFVPLNILD